MSKFNVVPFKAPETFARFGIDWTRNAKTERERALREAFLTYETSCGPNGPCPFFCSPPSPGAKEPSLKISRQPRTSRKSS